MAYRPSALFNVPMKILVPEWTTLNGVRKKKYPDPAEVSDDLIFFGSFRTFGGTETNSNGVYSVVNTAIIETWYRPDIKADCRIVVLATDAIYDVIAEPENIEMRNQYLKFRVSRVGGKA